MSVSEDQMATRRRALGRGLTKRGTVIRDIISEINGSPDLQFLNATESKGLKAQIGGLEKISENFTRLGNKLEGRND